MNNKGITLTMGTSAKVFTTHTTHPGMQLYKDLQNSLMQGFIAWQQEGGGDAQIVLNIEDKVESDERTNNN